MNHNRRLICVILASLCAGLLPGTGSARAQKQEGPLYIGDVFVQTIPARTYFCTGLETDFAGMAGPVSKAVTAISTAAKENKVQIQGPVLHCYFGGPHKSPDKQFKMETGFLVAQGTKAVGDFKVKQLPQFKCATVLYVGPTSRIGDGWQALYAKLPAKKLTPTSDERELYLYWEGADSANNIVQLQVGVK